MKKKTLQRYAGICNSVCEFWSSIARFSDNYGWDMQYLLVITFGWNSQNLLRLLVGICKIFWYLVVGLWNILWYFLVGTFKIFWDILVELVRSPEIFGRILYDLPKSFVGFCNFLWNVCWSLQGLLIFFFNWMPFWLKTFLGKLQGALVLLHLAGQWLRNVRPRSGSVRLFGLSCWPQKRASAEAKW